MCARIHAHRRGVAQVRAVLSTAEHVTRLIVEKRTSVLVHCSDGWDRTPQVRPISTMSSHAPYVVESTRQVVLLGAAAAVGAESLCATQEKGERGEGREGERAYLHMRSGAQRFAAARRPVSKCACAAASSNRTHRFVRLMDLCLLRLISSL